MYRQSISNVVVTWILSLSVDFYSLRKVRSLTPSAIFVHVRAYAFTDYVGSIEQSWRFCIQANIQGRRYHRRWGYRGVYGVGLHENRRLTGNGIVLCQQYKNKYFSRTEATCSSLYSGPAKALHANAVETLQNRVCEAYRHRSPAA